MKTCKIISLCLCIVFFFIPLLAGCQGNGDETDKLKGFVINEVMSRNTSTIADEDCDFSDWIEIYNGTNKTINLKNFSLTDDEERLGKWFFPAWNLRPGEYLLVFASGKDKTEKETGIFHTSFSLKDGETVHLCDIDGKVISKVKITETRDDISMGLVEGANDSKYVYFAEPTPGSANKGTWSDGPDVLSESDIVLYINEYMSSNNYVLFDDEGDAPDWIEIYNPGDEDISLKDFALTDDVDNVRKWIFPDVIIKSKDYLLLYLSGKKRDYVSGGPIHVDFKIGGEDEKIILTDKIGREIDSVKPEMLPENISVGRNNEGKLVYFPRPTPGRENSTQGFEELVKATTLENKGLWINEVAAVSVPKMLDGKGDTEWIELYNGSPVPVNLKGYGLTDDITKPFLLEFPEIILKPDSYLLVRASGSYYYNSRNGELSAPFKISSAGETIYLTEPSGVTIDAFSTGKQRIGISSGRIGRELDKRYFFAEPTPGAPNNSKGLKGYARAPIFSLDGGFVGKNTQISITSDQPGGVIRYTLDGSDPTEKSTIYSGPIEILKNTTLRARVFADGLFPSEDTTRTFITDKPHDIAVVCLSTDPDNLFDYNKGIMADGPGWTETFPHVGANFWKEWERPVHFEFYTEDGSLGVDFNAGIRLFGQYSRAEAQKSFSINLKEAYGATEICYPFFEDNNVTYFNNILLRTSGQDWGITKLKDAFCAQVIKGHIDLDIMDYRPVAVYINGEYWGLYNLREKVNESYLQTHRGVDPDNVDIIKGNRNVLAGSYDAYSDLLKYVKSHDLSKKEHYDYVSSLVDIDNFIDYWIVETFFNNTDTGNIKFYRERKDGAKWRWILFDMDWAMFRSTYQWNMVEEFINPAGHGVGKAFDTSLACGLIKNSEFKDRFIKRYADYLNSIFKTERMIDILDKMAAAIDSEIPRHAERWGKPSSYDTWKRNIDSLRQMLTEKPSLTKKHIIDTFNLSSEQVASYFG